MAQPLKEEKGPTLTITVDLYKDKPFADALLRAQDALSLISDIDNELRAYEKHGNGTVVEADRAIDRARSLICESGLLNL